MNSCVIIGVADVENGMKKTPRSAPTKANPTTFRREVGIAASIDQIRGEGGCGVLVGKSKFKSVLTFVL